MNKKAEMTIDISVQVILGVMATVILIILVVGLFSPVFSPGDSIAKSYFERFEEEIENVDEGREASFYIVEDGKEEIEISLVYFADKLSLELGGTVFWKKEGVENSFCVCYEREEVASCKYCGDLDLPARLFDLGKNSYSAENWIVSEGQRVEIKKDGGKYDVVLR